MNQSLSISIKETTLKKPWAEHQYTTNKPPNFHVPNPLSFLGLQQTSQLTRWSLFESPTHDQRKFLIILSILWATVTKMPKKGNETHRDAQKTRLYKGNPTSEIERNTFPSQKDKTQVLPPRGTPRYLKGH